MNPALLDSSLQYGALGLLGIVILAGAGIVVAMTRAMLRSFADQREAMVALIKRVETDTRAIDARIDLAERALSDNVNVTRHALRNVAMSEHGETRAVIEGLREDVRRGMTPPSC